MNKAQLKKLIKEVIREAESDTSPSPSKSDSFTPNTTAHKKEYGQLYNNLITLSVKGVAAGNIHVLKDFLKQISHEAKMKDLEIVQAEIEKGGKKVATLDSGFLKSSNFNKPEEDKFNTSDTKSVTSKTSKEKPPIQGSPEDWEKATEKDMVDTREKTRLKNAKISAGTYDPEDTTMWTDKEWDAWEEKDRKRDPKSWGSFDKAVKSLK